MNKKLIFIVLAVMVALLPMGIVRAQGELPPKPWTNSSTEFRPDIGLVDPFLQPGVNGYKIFEPGAISIFAIQGKKNGTIAPLLVSGSRYAATDAFRYNCGEFYYCGGGDHNSESDLSENEIWVDGCIKRNITGSTWANCTANHTFGYIAHTDTSMSGGFGWSFTGKSWHHFHKTGYVDWNPITQDNS